MRLRFAWAAAGLGVCCATTLASSASAQVGYDPVDSPWFFAVNAGVPSLQSGNLSGVGSAEVGYLMKNLGFEASGRLSAYDFQNKDIRTDNQAAQGKGEAWWVSGTPDEDVRFEIRAAGGGAYYDTTYKVRRSSSLPQNLDDETSWMGRGSLLVGLVVQPSSSFNLSFRGGAGGQYESYNAVSTTATNVIDDSDTFSFQANGRFRMRWSFIPEAASLRLWADGSYFTLRRSTFVLATSGAVTTGSEEFTQIEVVSRMFIDLDAVAFYGIVPGVFGGLDYFALSSNSGDTSTLVPVGGAALIRPW